MNGVAAAFAAIEQQIGGTGCRTVLESYRQHALRMTIELDRFAGRTRGDLICQEDLQEQGRALLLRIEQRISEESIPSGLANLHPVFAEMLRPFVAPIAKAA